VFFVKRKAAFPRTARLFLFTLDLVCARMQLGAARFLHECGPDRERGAVERGPSLTHIFFFDTLRFLLSSSTSS